MVLNKLFMSIHKELLIDMFPLELYQPVFFADLLFGIVVVVVILTTVVSVISLKAWIQLVQHRAYDASSRSFENPVRAHKEIGRAHV